MHQSCAPLGTPIGQLWVSVSTSGLVSVGRGDVPPPGIARDDDALAPVVAELAAYFAGERTELATPLDMAGASAFDAAVWTAARRIPYGQTVSYGELALMAGHPGAARAVGGSMARCPFAPVVPCHRVIHADGSIGGWAADTWVKRWLLDFEAAGLRRTTVQRLAKSPARGAIRDESVPVAGQAPDSSP